MTHVSFVETRDRSHGVRSSIKSLNINPVQGKDVLIKPNFNTADICPGGTHNDTLIALVEEIWAMGAKSISVGERSFPPTVQVMQDKGIIEPLKQRDVRIIDFDFLDHKDWVEFKPKDSHWPEGFRVARPIVEAECLIWTCCLKTHAFGGVFTMALKLAVGVVPTVRHGYNYMPQLHSSPHMRRMIAEIHQAFTPKLVVLDGVDAFVDGGPREGEQAEGNVFLASTDGVAVDAVGVAVLKEVGSNETIMNKKIFEQEQLARAVELGLGVSGPGDIELVPVDEKSQAYCRRVADILSQG